MISSVILQSEFKRIREYLKIILSNELTVNDLRSKPDFQRVFEKGIDVLSFLENKIKNNNSETLKFLDKFFTLTNKKIKVKEDIDFKDGYSIKDEINYISVYIKNIYKVDILDMKKSPIQTLINKTNKNNTINKNTNSKESSSTNNMNPNASPGMGFGAFGLGSILNGLNMDANANGMDFQKRIFAQAAAKQKLDIEIKTNKYYFYNSKPKIIIYLRYFIISLLLMLLVSIMTFLVFLFIQNRLTVTYDEWNKILGTTADSRIQGSTTLAILPANVGIILPFALLIFLSIGNMLNLMRFLNNDNNLYHINWKKIFWLLGSLLLFTISTVVFSGNTNLSNMFNFSQIVIKYYENNPSLASSETIITSFKGIYWSYLAIWIILGVLTIFYLLAMYFNPKPDINRYNQTLNNYFNEFYKS